MNPRFVHTFGDSPKDNERLGSLCRVESHYTAEDNSLPRTHPRKLCDMPRRTWGGSLYNIDVIYSNSDEECPIPFLKELVEEDKVVRHKRMDYLGEIGRCAQVHKELF